ncbi:MAG: isocitrate/isopropylmalate family dehydrogenase [Alphaproteobacteria bacterium]|nr:isocitrate/isopropylmalate family dehydrogenase [Alphaproteobacteria bacterium]
MTVSANAREFRIAEMPGDGIGVEVMDACKAVLAALGERVGGFRLGYELAPGGAIHYRDTGEALPESSFRIAEKADAILFGAMGWPDIRYPDGREIAPQLDLRERLGLYAGVRPIRAIPGIPPILADPRAAAIDMVMLRESTEGLFARRNEGQVIDDREARETLVITRAASERLFDFAFRLAERRRHKPGRGMVTCVDKANVFRAFAFFRKVFDERARNFPGVTANHRYIDAFCLDAVLRPWDYDVVVTENQFGDIISDLGAGLIGGMGMAPSGDVGDDHALFQPSHGTAPDIAGKGLANPTAMFLSAALMLDWLGDRHGVEAATTAGRVLERAVDDAFCADGLSPCEIGGGDGTEAITRAVIARIRTADPDRR